MKKTGFLLAALLPLSIQAQDFTPTESFYGTAYWQPDSLGNHRAVAYVKEKSKAVIVTLPWRRHDKEPENKAIIIVDASTDRQIHNFYRKSINQECGEIIFQPQTTPGSYYIYYLPYHSSGGPYPKVNYSRENGHPDPDWLHFARKQQHLPQAQFMQFQSRGSFNSFYPMEITATEQEKQILSGQHPDKEYLLFPEDRHHPIKMYDNIPYRWINKTTDNEFFSEVDLNEYFVFQIGLWATQKNLSKIRILFSDLKSGTDTIPASAFTCFNTEGTDWLQQKMHIECNVGKQKIQPFWIGVQIPEKGKPGLYKGEITVVPENSSPQSISVTFLLSDRLLTDKGDSDIYRLSRLRWLNSEIACNDEIVKPFIPLKVKKNTIHCLGRSVTLNAYGFPEQINSYFTEEVTNIGPHPLPILNAPIDFIIEQDRQIQPWQNKNFNFREVGNGLISWESENQTGDFLVKCEASMEFDGFMKYTLILEADKDTEVDDIRLRIPMHAKAAEYWLGMGHAGSKTPDKNNWKWDIRKNQEGFWFGTVNAGLHCVFRDENYSRPLNTNFYHSKPLVIPECWNNQGKGGIRFAREKDCMDINAYSGSRTFKKGEQLKFIFLLSITPFKYIDTQKQWNDRYLHSYEPIDKVVAEGANTINIHHGTAINPHINYPFFRPDFMKAYIDEAHQKGCKVKIYYTVRELANRAPELWALRSLGHEIFSSGKGNGYSWLQEHLNEDYIAAWFVEKYTDAAIVNSGVSRWHNFYVEGLNWLVQNVGIDGLYIDDLAFDRTTMKRIRKILDKGCPAPRIDLHSANQFNEKDGYINSVCLYMEHMPYLDRLWLGEYFDYEAGPDYWLTEVSGIPYGMMGEMLQDCGNAWRGMLYGMTSRLHWEGCEVAPHIWKVWDDFGIKKSRMTGYWVSDNPIQTNNKNILATSYIQKNKVMIALGSWAEKDEEIKLDIDWKKLGIEADKARLYAPEIPLFQSAHSFDPQKSIPVKKGKGWLLILDSSF